MIATLGLDRLELHTRVTYSLCMSELLRSQILCGIDAHIQQSKHQHVSLRTGFDVCVPLQSDAVPVPALPVSGPELWWTGVELFCTRIEAYISALPVASQVITISGSE